MQLARSARLVCAAAALALLTPLGLSPAARAAAPPPVLHVDSEPSAGDPLKLPKFVPGSPPLEPGACAGVDCEDDANVFAGIDVTGAPAQHVTVTVLAKEGLYVYPKVQDLGTIAPGNRYAGAAWSVAAKTPGFHTLTYEVTADGADPVQVSLPYLWLPGGAPLAGHDPLTGRLYGLNGRDYYQCSVESDCTYRYADRVEVVNGTQAHFALAHEGHATCSSAAPCSPYYYDAASGLIQVGTKSIGRVSASGLLLDNLHYVRMTYPTRNKRLSGTWRYRANVDDVGGVGDQRLVLTKSGHFDLRYSVSTRAPFSSGGDSFTTHLSGTYRVARHGKLVLDDPSRHLKKLATLAVLTDPAGHAQGKKRGVWLDLSINPRTGKSFVDGNRLHPVG